MTNSSSLRKRPSCSNSIRASGFTLVELLVVIAIVAILTAMTAPMIGSLKKANDLTVATGTIVGLLEQSRAYAMANNTYVFVCIEETDFTIPIAQTQIPGTGRVAVQSFSSQDSTMNLTSSNLAPIGRLQTFDSLNLPSALVLTTGNLSGRPSADYIVGSNAFPTASTSITSGNFIFSKIFAFDSRGEIHVPSNPPLVGLQYLEIDVQKSNGSSVPTNAKNQSAIQIDGLTGVVNTYRS